MQELVVYLTAVRPANFPSIGKGRAYFVKLSACSGKQRYPHERAARATAEDQEARARESGNSLRLRVYRCTERSCGGWHLSEIRDLQAEGY